MIFILECEVILKKEVSFCVIQIFFVSLSTRNTFFIGQNPLFYIINPSTFLLLTFISLNEIEAYTTPGPCLKNDLIWLVPEDYPNSFSVLSEMTAGQKRDPIFFNLISNLCIFNKETHSEFTSCIIPVSES